MLSRFFLVGELSPFLAASSLAASSLTASPLTAPLAASSLAASSLAASIKVLHHLLPRRLFPKCLATAYSRIIFE